MQQLDRRIPACTHVLDRRGCLGTLSAPLPTCGCRPHGQEEGLEALGSECKSSSVEGWWPACLFSPLGGRAGSHLPGSTVCNTATEAAKEGIFPVGAAESCSGKSEHLPVLFITPGYSRREACLGKGML